jgi:oligopeptide/dipeptide ABC transporter ATP-binding protein
MMVRFWRQPWIRKLAVPLVAAFFVGLIVRVVSTAFGSEGADGVRDGGVAESVGNMLMIAALVIAAPIVIAALISGAIWLVLTFGMPFASVPRALKIRRGRKQFEKETEVRVRQVLEDVGIDADAAMDRRPHEFSGGQAQRISIARALILDPKVIICDEPVSALDVSVQAQVLNLLEDLKVKYGISLVFIAHDLGVVKNISDRVVVMYLGRVCEVAPPDELFARPLHPYSAALMSSIPVTDPSVDPRAAITIGGELPSPVHPPSGCRFRTRCPNVIPQCVEETPELRELRVGQFVACHNPVQEYVSPTVRRPAGDAMWARPDRVGADASGSTLAIADN